MSDHRLHHEPLRRIALACVRVSVSVLACLFVPAASAAALVPSTAPAIPSAESGTSAPVASDWRGGAAADGLDLADDELAVFFAPRTPVTGALMASVVRRLGAVEGPLPGSSEFLMFVRLPRGDMRAEARAAQVIVAGDDRIVAVGPVFYRATGSGQERVAPTGDVIVKYRDGAALRRAANTASGDGRAPVKPVRAAPRTGVLRAASPFAALAAADRLERRDDVVEATPDWYRPRVPRSVPDDPLFAWQWHLDNADAGGVDVNVLPVWDTFRGSPSEVVAIVDDGVELKHADLAANVLAGLSWDYVGGDADPAPGALDDHGTACAGVAAARGFNGRGVSGAAPQAGLVGLRLLGATSDANEAAALSRSQDTIDIRSCSWGPTDDRHLEGPGPLAAAALADGVVNGRGGRGTVFVWAGGNGLRDHDDANFDGYANSRFVAAVAACDDRGVQSYYSERGANVLVTAPSSGTSSAITTVDRTGSPGYSPGDYTHYFGGTSAGAPLVAGCVALMLQANPDLTWRDVQTILATTAIRNDDADPGWAQNGAGRWVNHKYGFGLIDTAAAVAAAASWTTAGAQVHSEASAAPAAPVPDDDMAGVVSQVTVTDDIAIETVDVVLDAPHARWSDLRVELISPEGTSSVLADFSASDGTGTGYASWRFMTRRCLGESSLGAWTLRVSDRVRGGGGTFSSWTLRVHGRPAGAWTDDTTPVTTAAGAAGWHRTAADISFDAFDPDAAIARTEYSLDGGVWTEATGLTVGAPADHGNDGIHVLEFRSTAVTGLVEAVKRADVAIDTLGADARVPRRALVRRGQMANLSFRVNDALSPLATVTIRVKARSGRTVKRFVLQGRPTNVTQVKAFRCRLAKGTYRVTVSALDLAGNVPQHVGANRLVVR